VIAGLEERRRRVCPASWRDALPRRSGTRSRHPPLSLAPALGCVAARGSFSAAAKRLSDVFCCAPQASALGVQFAAQPRENHLPPEGIICPPPPLVTLQRRRRAPIQPMHHAQSPSGPKQANSRDIDDFVVVPHGRFAVRRFGECRLGASAATRARGAARHDGAT